MRNVISTSSPVISLIHITIDVIFLLLAYIFLSVIGDQQYMSFAFFEDYLIQ